MAIEASGWDDELCDLFAVPRAILPEIIGCTTTVGVTDSALLGGEIPICGMAGDQQAATIGHGCLSPGQTKATFGTGAFVLTNSGTSKPHSSNRLLATILVQDGDTRYFALEGSIFVAGSLIKWLRDDLGLLASAAESEELARSIDDNGGVYLVPALTGLGAPHWQSNVRGAIFGLSFATSKAHIARAALEAQAYQAHDLKAAFAADGSNWATIHIDGGMAENNWIAQDLADMLAIPVDRTEVTETTALGAAMLAATGARIHPTLAEAARVMRSSTTRFTSTISSQTRAARLAGWHSALAKIVSR